LRRRAALAGAAILAVLPMQVHYSREAKGYTFIQLALLVTILIWLRLFPPSTEGASRTLSGKQAGSLAATLFLSTGLAFGAHYLSALLMAVTGAWTLVWIAEARRRMVAWKSIAPRAGIWFSVQLAAGLAWLPWVLAAGRGAAAGTRAASANIGQLPRDPLAYLSEMLGEFGGGPTAPQAVGLTIVGALLALTTLGLVHFHLPPPARLERRGMSQERDGRWALASWLLGPVLLGWGVQVIIPFFYPRFLLYVTPALALLAGAGAELALRPHPRAAAWGSRAILAGGAALALVVGWGSAQKERSGGPETDLRSLAADLAAHYQESDGLIYSYHWQPGMLAAYLPSDRQLSTYASFFPPGTLDASMRTILERHGRIWLLTYQIDAANPINDVGLWLLGHAATPGGTWYDQSQLSLFIAPEQVNNPGPPTTCQTLSQQRIELCYVPLDHSITNSPGQPLPPLALALTWTAHEVVHERYVVFVHVVGPDGPVPIAQQDVQPVNGLRPTYTWLPGEPILDLHAVNLPPSLAHRTQPITLDVLVGLYDADTLVRVPVDSGGDSVRIGQVMLSGYR